MLMCWIRFILVPGGLQSVHWFKCTQYICQFILYWHFSTEKNRKFRNARSANVDMQMDAVFAFSPAGRPVWNNHHLSTIQECTCKRETANIRKWRILWSFHIKITTHNALFPLSPHLTCIGSPASSCSLQDHRLGLPCATHTFALPSVKKA